MIKNFINGRKNKILKEQIFRNDNEISKLGDMNL